MQFILNKNIYRLQRKPFEFLRGLFRAGYSSNRIYFVFTRHLPDVSTTKSKSTDWTTDMFVCFSCEAFLWHTGTVLWLELDVSDICYNWSMKWFYFQKLKFWNNNRRFFRFQETDDLTRKSNLTFLCKLLVPPAHHPLFNLVNILRLIRKCIKKFYVIAVKHFTE